jgi:hypothetical protein
VARAGGRGGGGGAAPGGAGTAASLGLAAVPTPGPGREAAAPGPDRQPTTACPEPPWINPEVERACRRELARGRAVEPLGAVDGGSVAYRVVAGQPTVRVQGRAAVVRSQGVGLVELVSRLPPAGTYRVRCTISHRLQDANASRVGLFVGGSGRWSGREAVYRCGVVSVADVGRLAGSYLQFSLRVAQEDGAPPEPFTCQWHSGRLSLPADGINPPRVSREVEVEVGDGAVRVRLDRARLPDFTPGTLYQPSADATACGRSRVENEPPADVRAGIGVYVAGGMAAVERFELEAVKSGHQ